MPSDETVDRPNLSDGGLDQSSAWRVAEGLVAELQHAIEAGDAERYNRHFARDVAWGSPYGRTVRGYDELHAIHLQLMGGGEAAVGGPSSRYEIVDASSPASDVVVTHVRRQAVDEHGEPLDPAGEQVAFSEMALYVLVRRRDAWWLAAGQNTIIAPPTRGRGDR